jgi:DNA polymerase elongation subunit (family B)
MKILLLDIETSPNIAHVWGLYKQNISISQLMDSSYVLCFAAKWLGEDEIFYYSTYKDGSKKLVNKAHLMLSEADAVIHFNGSRFDIPTLNKEFLLNNYAPPTTFQQIDLLRTARKHFRFPSNKLDYLAQVLGLGKKFKHAGHELWVKCMAGDGDAWTEMEKYNIQDVVLLEKVYHKLLPWISNHPSHAVFDGEDKCTNCGSTHLQRRGFTYTGTMKYQRYQCMGCGAWMKSKKAEKQEITITKDKNG